MTTQKLSEQQLLEAVARLREKTSIAEADISANTVGNVAGQGLRTAANVATAPIRGAVNVGNWVADKAGQAWDGIKQGAQNFATGVGQGFTTGGIDPLAPIQSPQQAAASFTNSGSQNNKADKSQATKPKPQQGGGNLGVKQMQKELGVTADGAIGPMTKAAMAKNPQLAAKYGFAPDGSKLATQAAPAAAPAQTAAPATAPAAAPATAPAAQPAMSYAGNNATVNTTQGPNMGQVNQGGYDPKTQMAEGQVGYDELERIVGLVHHR